MQYRFIQLDYLEKMAAGDPETRRELLRMLVDELESSGPRLEALWKARNRNELQWLCHHLKSTFPFAGNGQLAMANRELEQLLRQEAGFDEINPLVLSIQGLLPKVLKELQMELKNS